MMSEEGKPIVKHLSLYLQGFTGFKFDFKFCLQSHLNSFEDHAIAKRKRGHDNVL